MSLNPYCSGRWSRTLINYTLNRKMINGVLILIVVDDGLVRLSWTMKA